MRLVCELMAKGMDDRRSLNMRITAEALGTLEEAAEMAMTMIMEMCNHHVIYGKHSTLVHKDIRLICSLIDI